MSSTLEEDREAVVLVVAVAMTDNLAADPEGSLVEDLMDNFVAIEEITCYNFLHTKANFKTFYNNRHPPKTSKK